MGVSLATALRHVAHSGYLSAKGYAIRQLRAGREFRRVLDQLEQSQWYSRDRLRDLQNAKVRTIIAQAYENVPYYRRLFDRHGIKPADIVDIGDLAKVPTLSKDTLKANPNDFLARNFPRRLLASGWTTGTTGAPLRVRRTLSSIVFDKATLARQRRWAGVELYDRNVAVWGTAWGSVIVPHHATAPPFWRFNAADNQLLFSYYHLSDERLPAYLAKLRTFRPAFIEGFPSTMVAFARFLRKRDETMPLRAVFTTSEPLYPGQRREIEEAFQTRVFDYYGHAERAITAAECEEGNLHVNQEYGVLEILQGEEPAALGQGGEIVATGLTNLGMPLIRYRTGDAARLRVQPCPCGRGSQLLGRVDGRIADFIRTPDGRLMPGDGVMEAFYGLENIKESQVVQDRLDHVVVKLVRDDAARGIDTGRLRANLRGCLGDEIRVTVEYAESLWKEGEAKKRWVISKIGQGPGRAAASRPAEKRHA